MKGSDRLLTTLNQLLADKFAAIGQSMMHSASYGHRGYDQLHRAIEHQVFDETQHSMLLIRRIFSLEGVPVTSKPNVTRLDLTVPEIMSSARASGLRAVRAYHDAIDLAHEEADTTTAGLLIRILKTEEAHTDWAARQCAQIAQVGIESYLTHQSERH